MKKIYIYRKIYEFTQNQVTAKFIYLTFLKTCLNRKCEKFIKQIKCKERLKSILLKQKNRQRK